MAAWFSCKFVSSPFAWGELRPSFVFFTSLLFLRPHALQTRALSIRLHTGVLKAPQILHFCKERTHFSFCSIFQDYSSLQLVLLFLQVWSKRIWYTLMLWERQDSRDPYPRWRLWLSKQRLTRQHVHAKKKKYWDFKIFFWGQKQSWKTLSDS